MEIKSLFESKDGNVLRLASIKYIDLQYKKVILDNGTTITFKEDEQEDLVRLIKEFKEFRKTIDEHEASKLTLELLYLKQRTL